MADIANANPELAAIVAGHMHVKIDKAVVNGVIITEPDKYGRALSRIDLQFERRDGKFTLIDKNSCTYPIKGMTPDSAMQALYQPYHDVCAPMPAGRGEAERQRSGARRRIPRHSRCTCRIPASARCSSRPPATMRRWRR
ncbi:hypothetical protein M8494_37700 [Serratia ureilytica]